MQSLESSPGGCAENGRYAEFMQPRTTLSLLLVASLLGAFIYLYEIRGQENRQSAEEAENSVFPGISAELIDLIALRTNDGQSMRALLQNGKWRIDSPLDFPGDQVNISAVARSLASLTAESILEEPGDLQIYGLGEAAHIIHFRADGDDDGVRIGSRAPVGDNVYVSREGEPEKVYVMPSWRVTAFDHSLDEFRDRQVLSFDREAVRRVAVVWPGGDVTVERTAKGWFVSEPVGIAGLADASTVADLLSDIAFLRAEGFVDDGRSDEEAGLLPPSFAVTITLEDGRGERSSVGLAVGEEVEGGLLLARGADPRTLYRIPSTRVAEFPRRRFAFRFKELSKFETESAERLELTFAGGDADPGREPVVLNLRREDGSWKSDGDAWRPGAASRLIAELADLEGIDIVAESLGQGELAAVALAPPRLRLRVYGKSAPQQMNDLDSEARDDVAERMIVEVHLGTLDSERGIIARNASRDTIYRIESSLAEQIPLDLESLRSAFQALEEALPGSDVSEAIESEEAPSPVLPE